MSSQVWAEKVPQFWADSVAEQESLQISYSLSSCLWAGFVLQHTALKKTFLEWEKRWWLFLLVFVGLCRHCFSVLNSCDSCQWPVLVFSPALTPSFDLGWLQGYPDPARAVGIGFICTLWGKSLAVFAQGALQGCRAISVPVKMAPHQRRVPGTVWPLAQSRMG